LLAKPEFPSSLIALVNRIILKKLEKFYDECGFMQQAELLKGGSFVTRQLLGEKTHHFSVPATSAWKKVRKDLKIDSPIHSLYQDYYELHWLLRLRECCINFGPQAMEIQLRHFRASQVSSVAKLADDKECWDVVSSINRNADRYGVVTPVPNAIFENIKRNTSGMLILSPSTALSGLVAKMCGDAGIECISDSHWETVEDECFMKKMPKILANELPFPRVTVLTFRHPSHTAMKKTQPDIDAIRMGIAKAETIIVVGNELFGKYGKELVQGLVLQEVRILEFEDEKR
jgi:hypothetical protein